MSFKNTYLPVSGLLQSKGKLLDLSSPQIMGIINTTPDSFFADSRSSAGEELLSKAAQLAEASASILDIGGLSTRPGAGAISAQEEADRILPAIELLHKHFPDIWLSIDTYRASVARLAVNAGAHIVNDISGGTFDEQMLSTVAELKVPYVLMHLRGTPENMHQAADYGEIVQGVYHDLQSAVTRCREAGIKDVILDPGFGFSKSMEDNYRLLSGFSALRGMGLPILIGISRKSMIYKTLGISAAEALNGTSALHMVALQQGASILRVHDVAAAREVIQLFSLLN